MFGPPAQSWLMAIDVSGFHQIASYESSIQTEKEYIPMKRRRGNEIISEYGGASLVSHFVALTRIGYQWN